MVFELLTSPLTISNNYFVNSIIIGLIGVIAVKGGFQNSWGYWFICFDF